MSVQMHLELFLHVQLHKANGSVQQLSGQAQRRFFRFDKLPPSMGPTPNLDNCAFFEQALVTGVSITL
jgi:hypothetical protein